MDEGGARVEEAERAMDAEEYTERVLRVVERIPVGRVATYGDVAAAVGRGGPRGVGRVMARVGGTVCWWRVIRADGRPAAGLTERALARLATEGTPLRGDRVDLAAARWRPEPLDDLAGAPDESADGEHAVTG